MGFKVLGFEHGVSGVIWDPPVLWVWGGGHQVCLKVGLKTQP